MGWSSYFSPIFISPELREGLLALEKTLEEQTVTKGSNHNTLIKGTKKQKTSQLSLSGVLGIFPPKKTLMP